MRAVLLVAVPALLWFVGSVVVMWRAPREPAGMPAVARHAGQAVLRRVLGARPKAPRHRTTSGKGVTRHA